MFRVLVVQLAIVASLMSLASNPQAESIEKLEGLFANPPRDYSTGPLWVWNDRLTDDQIRSTLQDLAAQQVKQVWVHPRPGLMTPYLSDEWFARWETTLAEAERLDMNVWIYDENSYPSGFAGGFVPKAMPEARSIGIEARKMTLPAEVKEPVIAVYAGGPKSPEDVTDAYRNGDLPEDEYLVIVQTLAGSSPWFGGTFYVDLLRPGVTEKFLELTMEPYRERLGGHFGDRIPGVFTDEPHLAGAPGLHWTLDLPEQFEQRWGYDLCEHLVSLWHPVGDWQRVRHNYYQTLLDLFVERWGMPYYQYCEENNLEFTGHYWEHGWPGARIAPDNMAMYAWHQRPAIDTLFNQYDEGPNAQFGNVRAVIELASVANQLGRRRTLCEAYGGAGWDARFEDFKRIGDWLQVLGVNTINEHLSRITERGARKADYPPSFSYHTPWFDSYHVLAGYFTRVSAALSHGQQVNEILLIEPTTTAWMYQEDGEKLGPLGTGFQKLVTDLAKAQIEFDLGSEHIIAQHGSVRDGRFVVGLRGYHTVVIPAEAENLNAATVDLVEAFLTQGGAVIFTGETPPSRVDGLESDRVAKLAEAWQQTAPDLVIDTLRDRMGGAFQVVRADDDQGILYHHRRRLDEGDLVFLVNTSIDHVTSGRVEAQAGGVEKWNPDTGEIGAAYPFTRDGDRVTAAFSLYPCESLLLFLPRDKRYSGEHKGMPLYAIIEATGPATIQRTASNVLTLDYVDVTVKGETQEDRYFYDAARTVFRAHGLEENPWDHAVQFGDELISKTFPDDSGFEATYRFIVRDAVPDAIDIVIERADLYTVTCNGVPIAADGEDWWWDRAFDRIDIRDAARVGENTVTITAQPFTMYHELAAAYVVGDFKLATAESGFVIIPDSELDWGAWKSQGLNLYGDGVAYTQRFTVNDTSGPVLVELPEWYGSVAEVTVNGTAAGHVYRQPWTCDVTDRIRKGVNEVVVTVYGTPKNTIGPFHGNPGLGFAGPGSFRKGPMPGPPPGNDYDTLDYGLFAPFKLLQITEYRL